MKKSRKYLFVIASFLILISVFTACGSSGPKHSPYRTSEPTPVNPYNDDEKNLIEKVSKLNLPDGTDLLYVVAATGEASYCRFYALEKNGDGWDLVINTDGFMGENNSTPYGFYKLGEAFGTGKAPDKMNVEYRTIGEDECPQGEEKQYQYCVRITGDVLLYCKGDKGFTSGSVAISKGQMIRVMKQLTENSYMIIHENLDIPEDLSY